MSDRAVVPVLALALLTVGCAPREESADASQQAAEEAAQEAAAQPAPVDLAAALASLHQADADYARLASARDLDGWMALYAVEARMFPPESPELIGVDAIRTRLTGFAEDPNSSARFERLHAAVSPSGDMGYTMNLAMTTGTGPDGVVTSSRTRDFHVWRRLADGSWRIVIDMWAPAEPDSM